MVGSAFASCSQAGVCLFSDGPRAFLSALSLHAAYDSSGTSVSSQVTTPVACTAVSRSKCPATLVQEASSRAGIGPWQRAPLAVTASAGKRPRASLWAGPLARNGRLQSSSVGTRGLCPRMGSPPPATRPRIQSTSISMCGHGQHESHGWPLPARCTATTCSRRA